MRITEIIARKRDGAALTADEIRFFVNGYVADEIADYQASALAMAIYLRGMDAVETAALTLAMADSGTRLDLAAALPADAVTIDKHSTGGVGDKASLVVVPILAAGGLFVCKMSGRGLGHTGGTLDKLESIPGFRVALSPDEMIAQVRKIGACLAGQTDDLAPADKKLYALRDATATVGSLPLIVSSILSKKIAGGARHLLFDVKFGSGALMPSRDDAQALADALVAGGTAAGCRTRALLTDMNEPLGRTVGNALEVAEAIALLNPETAGDAHIRLRETCLMLAGEGFALAGRTPDAESGRALANLLLRGGDALAKFREIVGAQGGNLSFVDVPGKLPRAPIQLEAEAADFGTVRAIDAAALGNIVVNLGGGRMRKGDTIYPAVGLVVHKHIGDAVSWGDPLVTVHAATEEAAREAAEAVRQAFTVA